MSAPKKFFCRITKKLLFCILASPGFAFAESALIAFANEDLVQIPSSREGEAQAAVFLKAGAPNMPLVVSLHSWGGTYLQPDFLYRVARENNWNYVHPDYGGPQWLEHSCCFPESVRDIEDAIEFGVKAGKADLTRIAVIGKSGGGTGVLASYLESRFEHASFFAWAPIPDTVSWYHEVQKDPDLKRRYLQKILEGTRSSGTLDVERAKKKSPFYFDFLSAPYPAHKSLRVYAGIRDGLDGWSTSLSQPLSFYNKLLRKFPQVPADAFVDTKEFEALVEKRSAPRSEDLGFAGAKRILHAEKFDDIELVVFDGGHEIIEEQAVADLKRSFGDSK